MRSAPVAMSSASSRVSVIAVVSSGTKIPAARKVAAFPKCGSATKSVDLSTP